MRRQAVSKHRSLSEEAISVRRLCPAIDDHSLFVLEEMKQIKNFEAKSAIYRRGEAATRIYVLLEGRALLTDRFTQPRAIRAGVLCGIVEALSGHHYASELSSLTPCICSVIERMDLIDYLRRSPSVGLRLARWIGRDHQRLAESIRNEYGSP